MQLSRSPAQRSPLRRTAGPYLWHMAATVSCRSDRVRCYGASGDDIASIGGLLTERWLHRRRC